jgi:hypothetical protein
MMDLTAAIGNVLLPKARPRLKGGQAPSFTPAPAQKPVWQLVDLPTPIVPAKFADALSNTNPCGNQIPLYRFRELVNPLPTFCRSYAPGPYSTEGIWDNLITGATALPSAAAALAKAQQNFDTQKLSNLRGPGFWRPVYAAPDDWFAADPAMFRPVSIDPAQAPSPSSAYAVVGSSGEAPTSWRLTTDGKTQTAALDPSSSVKEIRFKALKVNLDRPWLDADVLGMEGISFPGAPGSYSSGEASSNTGKFPLLPTSFFLAIDLQIEGVWGGADKDILEMAQGNAAAVNFGHFALSSGPGAAAPFAAQRTGDVISAPPRQVIGWISTIVPRCP